MIHILDTRGLTWRPARKIASIRARPLAHLLSADVAAHLLIKTLEGPEPVRPDAMLCVGVAGEAWQQTREELLRKYTLSTIDAEGWLVFEPKSEAHVQFCPIPAGAPAGYIRGCWGATIEGVERLQSFEANDVVVRNPQDLEDQWIVRGEIFARTYQPLPVSELTAP